MIPTPLITPTEVALLRLHARMRLQKRLATKTPAPRGGELDAQWAPSQSGIFVRMGYLDATDGEGWCPVVEFQAWKHNLGLIQQAAEEALEEPAVMDELYSAPDGVLRYRRRNDVPVK